MDYIGQLTKDLGGQLVQTHTSWVILLDTIVYKIKKPVNFGFLDYSTLDKRKHFCTKEVELNKRLCPSIYIGTVSISLVNDKWKIEDDSNPVEFAVKMRRLDEKDLLLYRVIHGTANEEDVIKVADTVANFHLTSEKKPEFGKIEVMKFNTDENFNQVAPFIGNTIDREDFELIKLNTNKFYESNFHLFEKRIKDGKIVDGHGDIRLEHIAFIDKGICIFDCIEFNERFRCGDMVNDMCFLSTELDFYNRNELSYIYERKYASITMDEDFYVVLPFFKCYRAFVRGKVYSFLSQDKFADERYREEARTKAKKFFKLSREYSENIR